MNRSITIIKYHYVRELINSKHPNIKALTIKEFVHQLEYLSKYYTFVTMEECINTLQNIYELPPCSCLLTFDDGYIDHYNTVFPILRDNNIQGCFFPSAKVISTGTILDVNKIHFILANTYKIIDKLITHIYTCLDKYRDIYNLKSNLYYYNKLSKKSRYDSAEVIFIKRLLQKELKEDVRKLIIDELFKKYVTHDQKSFYDELYLNLDHLKYMAQNGMYIGSHGFDHCWLNELNKAEQEVEIEKSLVFLKLVNGTINNWTFCYPYGAYNDCLIDILKIKGCKMALTTKIGIAKLSNDNAYKLERLDTNDIPKTANAKPNSWKNKLL